MSKLTFSRRKFLQVTSGAIGACGYGTGLTALAGQGSSKSPIERLNIGVVGVGGRGWRDLQGVATENIVALCDVDERYLAKAKKEFPKAKGYIDWRKMLEQSDVEAVVVATPDHNHAVVGVAAMESRRHVYCEKPLAHSVHEARVMTRTAKETGVMTQLGNQRHASNSLRRVVELVRSGGLGSVREVICWSRKTGQMFSPGDRPSETAAVPDYLDWNAWIGPAPKRPYHPTAYHPKNWRGWWDFGSGNFGDMACHIMDAPFWSLDLKYPETIKAEGPPVHPESAPPWLVARFEFPARGNQPPVKLSWYDGERAPPDGILEGVDLPSQGALFIGEKGRLLFPHGGGETQMFVGSESVPIEYPEPTLDRPDGHHREWIRACKTGEPSSSDFAYGGPLTEAALAGIVAYRTGGELQWDGQAMKAPNAPEAERYIRPSFREGWSLFGL